MDNNVSLRLLRDDEKDYKLLYRWYQNKDVYTYFEQRIPTYNEIIDKYSKRTSIDSVTPVYMIEYNHIPIGIIQYTKISNELKKLHNIDKDGYEIDIFIGEEGYYNKGIGGSTIKLLIDKLKDKDIIFIMIPEVSNERAIKCYEKVGFTKKSTFYEPDTIGIVKEKVVMVFDKN